jgi:hypothetical protein
MPTITTEELFGNGTSKNIISTEELFRDERKGNTLKPQSALDKLKEFVYNTSERPAAANRAAIRKNPGLVSLSPYAGIVAASGVGGKEAQQAYTYGSLNPEQIPTFQNESLDEYYKRVGTGVLQQIGGLGVSAAGMTADMVTNPVNWLLGTIGKIPTGIKSVEGIASKTLGEVVGGTKAGKAINSFATKERGVSDITKPVVDVTKDIVSKTIRLKRFLSGEQLPQKTEKIATDLDDLKTLFGQGKAQAISQVADVPIKDIKTLNSNIGALNLPATVTKRLQDPLYKIEFLPDGSIKPTMGNMDKKAQALSDTMSDTEWQKSSNMVKAATKRAYGFTREAMKDTVPSIKNELDAYHEFMNNVYNPVTKKLYRSGQLVEKPFRSALGLGAEQTTKQAIGGARQMSPEINKSVNDVLNYGRVMNLLKLMGITAGGGLAVDIGKRILRPPNR